MTEQPEPPEDDWRIAEAEHRTWYPEPLSPRRADGIAADTAAADPAQDAADRREALRRAARRAQR